jgi:hypothetical protein
MNIIPKLNPDNNQLWFILLLYVICYDPSCFFIDTLRNLIYQEESNNKIALSLPL